MEAYGAPLSTNLLGQHVVWSSSGHRVGGTVVAVTFYEGSFMLLVATDDGLQTKHHTGVRVE